ncbi:hypothetical protein D3C85_1678360 [compost metagenome]
MPVPFHPLDRHCEAQFNGIPGCPAAGQVNITVCTPAVLDHRLMVQRYPHLIAPVRHAQCDRKFPGLFRSYDQADLAIRSVAGELFHNCRYALDNCFCAAPDIKLDI